MIAEVCSGMMIGIQGVLVTIQSDISDGLPIFYMIGYLSSEVREARERVRTAIKNTGIYLPAKRISVNLAPAGLRKSGVCFDLAIAVSLFIAMDQVPASAVSQCIILGELALDGKIMPVHGILPILKKAVESGIRRCVIPRGNESEAALLQSIEIFPFSHLSDVLEYLRGRDYSCYTEEIAGLSGSAGPTLPGVDFAEIKGQSLAKRAMEIAATGFHNILLEGPPGAGKTMLASALPGIMPDMNWEEKLHVTMIHSTKRLLTSKEVADIRRPFRAPSVNCTMAGMFGGGRNPKPGEISLAHHGVLFMDEIMERNKETLEMLRVPLEEHRIDIMRQDIQVSFPADFILAAACNPCPCGYYPDRGKCRCRDADIQRYRSKLSGPVRDRIDLFVRCDLPCYENITASGKEESSLLVRKRVEQGWAYQRRRQGSVHNGRLSQKQIHTYCRLDSVSEAFMKQAYQFFHLTGRSYYRILKLARTIADMESCEAIQRRHLEEALQFRWVSEEE